MQAAIWACLSAEAAAQAGNSSLCIFPVKGQRAYEFRIFEQRILMKNVGYSGTPLFKKLGMKEGTRWKIINAPDNYFHLLGETPNVTFVHSNRDLDGIHVFTNCVVEVEKGMENYRHEIKKSGCLWFSWYKKSAKLATEITEDVIRDTALALGLVDVKVCAVDHHWSALKIVWRVENR